MFIFGCEGCNKRMMGMAYEGRVTSPPGWQTFLDIEHRHAYFACSEKCRPMAEIAYLRETRFKSGQPPLVAAKCDHCAKVAPAEYYSANIDVRGRATPIWTRPDGWYMRRIPGDPASHIVCSQACATELVRMLTGSGVYAGTDLTLKGDSLELAAASARTGPDIPNPVAGTDAVRPLKYGAQVSLATKR